MSYRKKQIKVIGISVYSLCCPSNNNYSFHCILLQLQAPESTKKSANLSKNQKFNGDTTEGKDGTGSTEGKDATGGTVICHS